MSAPKALFKPQSALLISPAADLADEHLWAEALNLGVYDVLAKPLDDSGVVRVLSLALNHRRETPVASTLAVPLTN